MAKKPLAGALYLAAEVRREYDKRMRAEEVRARMTLLYLRAQQALHRAGLRCPEAGIEGPYACPLCH